MKLPPHSSPDRPHGVRWLVLPGAALTMLFALLLLFQPQRDGLILWPCAFDATPEAVVLLAVCVVVYVAAALLLMRTWSDAPSAHCADRSGRGPWAGAGFLAGDAAVRMDARRSERAGGADGGWLVRSTVESQSKDSNHET